jgi:hypothetical protein
LNAPFREAGIGALNKLIPLTDYQNFGMQQFQQDPGYAFRMSEGMKGLERSAAARGGLLSGAAMKGIQRFGQDLASQEYQNAFNRYGIERDRRLNPLQSLAGVGQTSTNQLASAGQNYATGAGQAIGAAGQARASGYVGQSNALTGALGGASNMYMQGQMLNRMFPSSSGGSSTNFMPTMAPSWGGGGGGDWSQGGTWAP